MNPAGTITLDSIVAQSETVVSAEVGAEVVMLHVDRNAYYDTDAIGAQIWRRMMQPVLVRDIRDGLLHQYAVDADTCAGDVLAFLREAYSEGVIRII